MLGGSVTKAAPLRPVHGGQIAAAGAWTAAALAVGWCLSKYDRRLRNRRLPAGFCACLVEDAVGTGTIAIENVIG